MVPSSFMISQITADGLRPAKRARSTPASVCPVRSSTPPGRAMSGNTWPGCTSLIGRRLGVDGHLDGVCAIGGRDAGGDAFTSLHRDRERSLQTRLVALRHGRQVELRAALRREREADQAAPFLGHEVDALGGGELRR